MSKDVILDTNVFVGAAFNPDSHSARIVGAIRDGRLRLVWNATTRRETRHVLEQIPPLSWPRFADLFRVEDRHAGETHPERFSAVPDPDDREFAALAAAAGAILITQDAHLLGSRDQTEITILTPHAFLERAAV